MRDGYEPTTMLSIAAEARVAEDLYLGYPSKAALLKKMQYEDAESAVTTAINR